METYNTTANLPTATAKTILSVAEKIIEAPVTIINRIKSLINSTESTSEGYTITEQATELTELSELTNQTMDLLTTTEITELAELTEQATELTTKLADKTTSLLTTTEMAELTEQATELAEQTTILTTKMTEQAPKLTTELANPSTTPLLGKPTQYDTFLQSQSTTEQAKVDMPSMLEYLNSPYTFSIGIFLIITLILFYTCYKGGYLKYLFSRRREEPTVVRYTTKSESENNINFTDNPIYDITTAKTTVVLNEKV